MLTDHLSIASFNMMTFHEMNELTIFKKSNRRRRWRIGECEFPRLRNCFFINTSKNCRQLAWFLVGILKCPFYAWPGSTCSTSAHRIYYQQRSSFLIVQVIFYLFGSLKFSETHAC